MRQSMRQTKTVLCTLAILGAGLAARPLAAQETDEFRWQGPLAAGRTLEIVGLNGDIHAAPASSGTVDVVAVKHARRTDPREVRIEVVEHAGGVRICAVYPRTGGAPTDVCEEGGEHSRIEENDVIVDFTVRVPAGVTFVARTVNGGIETESLHADVRAYTVNGGVSVSGTGTVEAHTVNGAIEASVGSGNWQGTLTMETVNGSITVRLPGNINARVEAETVNGGLTSDFPLTVMAGERLGPKRIEGTIGAGGGTLRLETVNGSIGLVRG